MAEQDRDVLSDNIVDWSLKLGSFHRGWMDHIHKGLDGPGSMEPRGVHGTPLTFFDNHIH